MRRLIFALLVVVTPVVVLAMPFGQGTRNDSSEKMMRWLGKHRGFSALVKTTTANAAGNVASSSEMQFYVAEGNARMEMNVGADASKKKGRMKKHAGEDDDSDDEMAAMGFGKMVTIHRSDLKKTLLVYPDKKAYVEMPDTAATDTAGSESTFEKKELGNETVDGHPCVKYAVTRTDPDKSTHQATVWEAKDLSDFPIQTQTVENGETVTTLYTNIKPGKPAASLFEPPSDFKRYSSMQELMMSSMQQMMMQGGAGNE